MFVSKKEYKKEIKYLRELIRLQETEIKLLKDRVNAHTYMRCLSTTDPLNQYKEISVVSILEMLFKHLGLNLHFIRTEKWIIEDVDKDAVA